MLRDSSFLLTLLIFFSSASSSLPEKLLNSQLFLFFYIFIWNYFNKIRRLSNDCPHLEIIVNWISDRVPNYRMTTHPQFSFFCPWLSFGLLISHTTNKIAETRNKAIYMGFINTYQESPDLYIKSNIFIFIFIIYACCPSCIDFICGIHAFTYNVCRIHDSKTGSKSTILYEESSKKGPRRDRKLKRQKWQIAGSGFPYSVW